ncbi:MAG: hypothetical protein U1F57_09950 [bacterium]
MFSSSLSLSLLRRAFKGVPGLKLSSISKRKFREECRLTNSAVSTARFSGELSKASKGNFFIPFASRIILRMPSSVRGRSSSIPFHSVRSIATACLKK